MKTSPPAAGDAFPDGAGSVLRARREELGLTLDQVARETQIPVLHLQSLEDGRVQDLPAGPYASAYLRALEDFLGVAVDGPPPVASPVAPGIPLSAVRAISVAMVAVMAVAVGWSIHGRWVPPTASSPQGPTAVADHRVSVSARRSVDLRVRVDDRPTEERAIAGGEVLALDAFDRVEVDVPALDAVKLEFDGVSIVPQGRQDVPRALVFVNDGGSR